MKAGSRGVGHLAPLSVLVISLLLSLSVVSSLPPSSPLSGEPELGARALPASLIDTPAFVPGEVLVKVAIPGPLSLNGAVSQARAGELQQAMKRLGITAISEVVPGTYRLRGPSLDVAAAAEALRATGAVSYAGPNYLYRASAAPDDEQYVAGQQWGVTQIKAEQAWDITTGANTVVIAVVDTGTAVDHPDLEDKIVQGHDFVNGDNSPYDDNGHGTYTAGIAAAMSNNGRGVTGISWGARIMPVKVLSDRGNGAESDIAQGIHFAVDNGARIINASFGGIVDSPVLREAVQYAVSHNVLFVAASGNTPDGADRFPAAYDGVLAVGATGRNDTYTGFSSWGPFVRVTAPGVGILSTGWADGTLTYEYGNGTSASAPFVSGVAALVLSVNPGLTAQQVRQIIEDSSDDLGPPGWDEHYGTGRLDAFNAVKMAQQGSPTLHTPTPPVRATDTPAPSQPTATKVPQGPPTLTLAGTALAPGALLSVTGANFRANELIDFAITRPDGIVVTIGNAQADGNGAFRAEMAVPRNSPPGRARITAIGNRSNAQAFADFAVTGGTGGKSRVAGTIKTGGAQVNVILKPSTVNGGQILTMQADSTGAYSFGGLAADRYLLSASAQGYLPAGPYVVELDGTQTDVKTINIAMSLSVPPALARVQPVNNTQTLAYFGPVGHTLSGAFLKYWQTHGGLAIFGYPISEPFQETSATDGKTYTVQYFERNRFELHPEFANSVNEVLMGLLGVDSTRGRAFAPGQPVQNSPTRVYFAATQHTLSGAFLKYWQTYGGLAIFGYPISEPMTENGYTVQYFERNRFELHPEFANSANEVLLGLLGVETVQRNGWLAP